ncbi:unnamed protein product [Miscanthus lutarioriparius]|uniref:Uncharacterized protein n=1 Tax=Miscanthus lutarioriparius TaxID=422564 RepID=A0A811Q221_9POAL|nr:unnamed protein product [Miscanthus lutarioriparius]
MVTPAVTAAGEEMEPQLAKRTWAWPTTAAPPPSLEGPGHEQHGVQERRFHFRAARLRRPPRPPHGSPAVHGGAGRDARRQIRVRRARQIRPPAAATAIGDDRAHQAALVPGRTPPEVPSQEGTLSFKRATASDE